MPSMLRGTAHALIAATLVVSGCASVASVDRPSGTAVDLVDAARARAAGAIDACSETSCGFRLDPAAAVDSVVVDRSARTVRILFNDEFGRVPFRSQEVAAIHERISAALGGEFDGFTVLLETRGTAIAELVPNLYRSGNQVRDESRRPSTARALRRHVRNLDRPIVPSSGLDGRHIAIWPSHGWYYEVSLERWEWQRPRLFRTVEDLLPMSFVVPYLEPMLRRSGASVYLPRERDVQPHEVVVDNDGVPGGGRSRYNENTPGLRRWFTALAPGYAHGDGMLHGTENPFRAGTVRVTQTDLEARTSIEWIPDIPERGEYAVYVSYGRLAGATSDARYTVHHLGGSTAFSVDQTMGGGTWTYLGTFLFEEGVRPVSGRVVLENGSGSAGATLSADAVRFGGGMGNVVRDRSASGRPRFTEAARYYMQYGGMPDSLVYNVTESFNDYTDDYRGRAEWVNYLRGAPQGPNKDRENAGLGIPIDMSLAFHTDAGAAPGDSTIGTLMIYSSEGFEEERVFPDGVARLTNRDLGDIIQTQVVQDMRALFDSDWNRRGIWDSDYSEAVRPNVPGVLLELLSHQNFSDMTFALDPRFRFHASRAIYKAILRYLATQYDEPFVVQPLPVTHPRVELSGERTARLRWNPRSDALEPTAEPSGYVVYTRAGDTGFDNGTPVGRAEFELTNLEPGVVYSFRIAAFNAGGESAPSEVVSVGVAPGGGSPVLVVNGFDRVSGPATVEEGDWRGFAGFLDEGVADVRDASYVGDQYDFDVNSPWKTDDAPGHGASHATFDTRVLTGNTFDYAAVHGEALLSAGRSFVTSSNEAVAERLVDLSGFEVIDVILGEQRTTIGPGDRAGTAFRTFSLRLQAVLDVFAQGGGDLFISGAYVGTDLFGPDSREEDRRFAEEILRLKWQTNHASLGGTVISSDEALLPFGMSLAYNTDPTGPVYRVEAPDAVEPIDDVGRTLLRYADNNTSAAYGYRGDSAIVVMGFPFETILTQEARAEMMGSVLRYLSDSQ